MRYLLLTCLLFNALSAPAQKRNVLVVGNSITFYNDMPVTIQHLCDDNNAGVHIEQSTFPGMALREHLRYSRDSSNAPWRAVKKGEVSPTMTKILSKKWDKVILQERSDKWLIPEMVQYDVLSTLKSFDSVLSIQKTEMLIMEPYTLRQYPKKYCYPTIVLEYYIFISGESVCSPEFQDDNSEYRYIDSVTGKTGKALNKDFIPVGKAFKLWHDKYPEIVLYGDDHGHPNQSGSYLIALLYYKAITGTFPDKLTHTGGISKAVVENLKQVAMDATK